MYEIEGEPLTRADERLFGRYHRPLPESALMVMDYAPAVQKVSPEERKRRVAELKEKVKDGVLKVQQSEDFRNYLIAMSRFHEYSWHNQLLIWVQRPDATLVKGFQGWKELGRYVKKGETGIRILAPAGPTGEVRWVHPIDGRTWVVRKEGDRWVALLGGKVDGRGRTRKEVVNWLHKQGAIARKEVIAVERFIDVSVFDIKQTDGKPLPEFIIPTLTGDMNQELWDATMAILLKKGVYVTFEPRPHQSPEIKGSFHYPKHIWVKPDEPPAQRLKTLLHEAAHYYSAGPFQIDRRDAETLAESVAFVVGAHHGFDTGARSFPYVAMWARDEDTLRKNLGNIQKVSEHIIEELEEVDVKVPPAPPPPTPPTRPIEPAPPPPPRPSPRPIPSPKMTPEEMEATYSLEKIKELARMRGVSTAGSKRDIIRRLL